MSRTGAEWVSAPTARKSTPVAATSRATSRVSPPRASSRARPALIGDGLGASARAACCRAGPGRRPRRAPPRSWSSVVTSTWTGRSGKVLADGRYASTTPPAASTWLSLISAWSDKRHPVVDAAAAAHGVLLQQAVAAAASCGCRGPSRRCPSSAATQCAVVVATPDRWHRKFSAVRSAVSSSPVGPSTVISTSPRLTGSPSATRRDHRDVGADDVAEDELGDRQARHHAVGPRHEVGDGRSRVTGMVAALVTSSPVGRSSSMARTTASYTSLRVEAAARSSSSSERSARQPGVTALRRAIAAHAARTPGR